MQKKCSLCLFFQKTRCWPHEQTISHLLSSQRHTAIYSLENIQTRLLWHFRVDDIEDEITVFDSILKLGRQFRKPLAIKLAAIRKAQLKFIPHESLKRGQTLQAVHNYHLTFVIFCHVENRERNTHDYRFDQFALLVFQPYKVALEVGVHYIPFLIDPPNGLASCSSFVPN